MVKIIFFATLVLFPFGQLIKIGFVNLFDVLILLLAIITVLKWPKYPEWYKYFTYFLISCVLGLLVNNSLFTAHGSLYLLRLWSYSMIAVYVFNFVKDRKAVVSSLLAVSAASAIFGWIQYFFWPDLTALKYLGWDDHLLRMVGTFLDPTFLGLILVLGIILAFKLNLKLILYFLLFSLAFTYSRASYLVAGLFLLLKKQNLALAFFILVVLFLPKNIGEGTNLARTVSGNSKLYNYQETIEIIKKTPVFGVGFNNICKAKEIYLNDLNINSHGCNGADSSILFLIATTGIVGLILFVSFLTRIPNSQYLIYSLGAVLVHSLFVNSLFYPHIMFWIFALIGSETKSES